MPGALSRGGIAKHFQNRILCRKLHYQVIREEEEQLLYTAQSEPRLKVPSYIERPAAMPSSICADDRIRIYRESDVAKLAKACEIARLVLDFACEAVDVGVTTNHLNDIVHVKTTSLGAYPSPLNYFKFPKSVCTSINNVLCHGIPSNRPLKRGDIVNIDVTVFYRGFHGDTSRTVQVGESASDVDENGRRLVQATRDALNAGISVCGPGQKFSEIGNAISKYVRDHHSGFLVDPSFCGHGIGRDFHAAPTIQHVPNHDSTIMKEGMSFTIEPILLEGQVGFTKWKSDGWTCVSEDDLRSAQFEHTLVVTSNGVSVLT